MDLKNLTINHITICQKCNVRNSLEHTVFECVNYNSKRRSAYWIGSSSIVEFLVTIEF